VEPPELVLLVSPAAVVRLGTHAKPLAGQLPAEPQREHQPELATVDFAGETDGVRGKVKPATA
jgi:hypothetical protein